ncbi:MAG: 5'(3')-deoxyribonucleotidase [Ferruginibacter sp.]
MKRISIDMDGVMADVYSHFIELHKADFGETLIREQLNGKTEDEAFPALRRHVISNGFFRNTPVIENSQRIVQKLNDRFDVYIVSAAMEFPNSLVEKQAWLNEHFPFISWKQMVFCGSKAIIRADYMIDDHFKNLDYFTGETILFTQPHNVLTDAGKHKRVTTWEEVEKIFFP